MASARRSSGWEHLVRTLHAASSPQPKPEPAPPPAAEPPAHTQPRDGQ